MRVWSPTTTTNTFFSPPPRNSLILILWWWWLLQVLLLLHDWYQIACGHSWPYTPSSTNQPLMAKKYKGRRKGGGRSDGGSPTCTCVYQFIYIYETKMFYSKMKKISRVWSILVWYLYKNGRWQKTHKSLYISATTHITSFLAAQTVALAAISSKQTPSVPQILC